MGSSSAGPLRGRGGFAFAAPIPPLTFFRGEARVAGLGDGGLKSVEDAGVLTLAGEALEAGVEFVGIVLGELGNRANAESVEIAFDGGADGDEVLKTALLRHGGTFRISLYFRHGRKQNIAHFW